MSPPTLSPTLAPRACPICAGPAVDAHRPFCSKRCAEVDLQRWFSGRYAIPAASEAADDEDA